MSSSHRGISIYRHRIMSGLCKVQRRGLSCTCACVCARERVQRVTGEGVTPALILQMLFVLNDLMYWPAGGSTLCTCHFLCLSCASHTHARARTHTFSLVENCRMCFQDWVHHYILSTSEGIYCVRGRHNRISVFVSDYCLSEPPQNPTPPPSLSSIWAAVIERADGSLP